METIELDAGGSVWRFQQALHGELAVSLPPGLWPDQSSGAAMIPLRHGSSDAARCFGFLVAGQGLPDVACRTFLRVLAAQFTMALAAAGLRTEFARAARSAETALRTKDEFPAMLGHELRNPLAPILTALELTRMRGTESRELVVIQRQVGHLVRLVDDLLDVSRIAGGQDHAQKTAV